MCIWVSSGGDWGFLVRLDSRLVGFDWMAQVMGSLGEWRQRGFWFLGD